MSISKSLVVVVGPTGIGKSVLSVRLAQHFGTEIISSDSRQIYRELSVGTAVPPPSALKAVRHHLIHSHSLYDRYNAGVFERDALQTLDKLFREKDVVIMSGGSMLYVSALCNGIDHIPEVDEALRAELNAELDERGIEHMRLRLKSLDPAYYAQTDLSNPRRLLRAIEICITTGKPYSSFRTKPQNERPFTIIKVGLNMDRKQLYDRINRRVDMMLEEGLEEEARKVFPDRHLNSLNTVGYKELFAFFEGRTDRATAINLIKRNTRRYAKRQLTWFEADPLITWFYPTQEKEIIDFVQQHIITSQQP